ncbi:MAG: serine/threonine-protein kinase, partial [Myxococcota bacterium]
MSDIFAGRYRVIEPLGSGAQGVALQVMDMLTNRPAVLKLGRSGHESYDGTLSEFEALRGLTSPYIAPVMELGFASTTEIAQLAPLGPAPVVAASQTQARPYLVRAWIDGPTVLEWAQERYRESTPQQAIADISQVLAHLTEAIAELHRNTLIHSDLKPEHVLIVQDPPIDHHPTPPPRPALIDFGLAISQGSGLQGGTPAYMAPERLRGSPASQEADRFALGLVMAQVLLGEPVGLSQLDPSNPRWNALPARVRQTIRRLLDDQPERRPHLAAVRAALLTPTDAVQGWRAPARRTLPFLGLSRLNIRDSLTHRALRNALPPVILFVGERGSGRSRMLRQTGWSLQSRGRPALELLSGQEPWSRLLQLGPRLASLANAHYQRPSPESFVGDRAGWIQHLAGSLSSVRPPVATELLWDDVGFDPIEGLDTIEALTLALEQAQGMLRLWATTTPDRLGPLRSLFASAGFELVTLEPLTPDDLHGLHGRDIAGRHLSYGELQRLHDRSQGLPGRLARLLETPSSLASQSHNPTGPESWVQALAGLVPGGISQHDLQRAAYVVGITQTTLESALEWCVRQGTVIASANLERAGQLTWTSHTPDWTHLHEQEQLGEALALFADTYPHLTILSAALQHDRTALEQAWQRHSTTLKTQQANALVMTVLEPALAVAPSAHMLRAYADAALESGALDRAEARLHAMAEEAAGLWAHQLDIARARLAFASGDLNTAEARVDISSVAQLPIHEQAQAALMLSQIDMRRGRYRQAYERAASAAQRFERTPDDELRELRADLWVTAAAAAAFLGQDGQQALDAARHALEHLEVPARIQARYHGLKAVAAYIRGALDEATEDYREALEIVEQAGLAADRPLYLLNLGTAYERQVRLSHALLDRSRCARATDEPGVHRL